MGSSGRPSGKLPSSLNKSPFKKKLFFNGKSRIKKPAVSAEPLNDPSSFYEIEIPFDWDADDNLESSLIEPCYSYSDTSHVHQPKLSETFIPLPGFSKYSSKHNTQDPEKKIKSRFKILLAVCKYFFILIFLSLLLFGPPLFLELIKNKSFQNSFLILFYKKYQFFAVFSGFCIISYNFLWIVVDYVINISYYLTHEHHFDTIQKKLSNSKYITSFNYSVIFSILNPNTFEIIMMSKFSIFLFFYVGITTLTYKVCYLYIYATQHWAMSLFAFLFNRVSNALLLTSIVMAIKTILFAKIVSDFYLTVYSERLMDLCFAIQAIHRLLSHVEDANQKQLINHEYCQCSNKKMDRKYSKNKSFSFLSPSAHAPFKDEELHEDSIEPIISSYHQFRQLLLNSVQFEGIIDSKAAAKTTARLIYEHFYTPFENTSNSIGPFAHKKKASLSGTSFIPFSAKLNSSNFANLFNSADAEKLFQILQLSKYSAFSPMDFKLALVKLYEEKEVLAKSLLDHGGAVKKLEHLFSFFAMTIIIILTPLVIGLPVKELFAIIGGLCSLSFMFGQSSAVIFNSIIFMFITHPFDVGDRVIVFSETYFVHEIGIYYTVFQTVDNLLVYIPNSILIDQHIVNVNRSKNMTEWIDLVVDYNTTTSQLLALAAKLRKFIENENKDFHLDHYQQNLTGPWSDASNSSFVKCIEAFGCRTFRLGITLCHKYNFQNGFDRADRHVKFMRNLHEVLKELNIIYYPPQLRLRLSPELF